MGFCSLPDSRLRQFAAAILMIGSMAGSALFQGCASVSEDDYVAGIIAEAMQEAESEVTSQPAPEKIVIDTRPPVQPAQAIAVQPAPAVSIMPGGAVSISAPSTVSVGVQSRDTTPITIRRPEVVTTVSPAPSARSGTVEVAANTAGRGKEEEESAELPAVRHATPEIPPNPNAVTNVGGRQIVVLKPTVPTIQPDAVLWISVDEDPSLNGRYLVSGQASIDFGYVGLVFLQDLSVEQAEVTLRNVLEGRYLNKATVKVRMAKASSDQVSIIGGVGGPGQIRISPGTAISLNEALLRAGGIHGEKKNIHVKIVRGGMLTPFGPAAEGETYALSTSRGELAVPSVFLRNNDIAYVFRQERGIGGLGGGGGPKEIILLGEVPRRGVVSFAENEPCTLMYLLFKIGGLPRFAKGSKIKIVRRDRQGRETTMIKNGDALMEKGDPDEDVVLESGDRVVVPSRTFSFF